MMLNERKNAFKNDCCQYPEIKAAQHKTTLPIHLAIDITASPNNEVRDKYDTNITISNIDANKITSRSRWIKNP